MQPPGPIVAQVAVNRPVWAPYTYSVPVHLAARVAVGSRVRVPFGRQTIRGVVVVLGSERPADVPNLRDIEAVLDPIPLLDGPLIELGTWVSDHYLCPPGEALDAMTPAAAGRENLEDRYRVVKPPPAGVAVPARARRTAQLLDHLTRAGQGLSRAEVARLSPQPTKHLVQLIELGLVETVIEAYQPVRVGESSRVQPIESLFCALTSAQERTFAAIVSDLQASTRAVHLIHGITGSGKTEIYLHLIRRCRSLRRGAIFLLPEIALTIPMMTVLKSRFGDDVALLHSGLTPRERYGEWLAIARGEKGIVVGARSAVFAPLADPGLIVIDEEPETSYKQNDKPYYHAREVARQRALRHRAVLVLGSATPSLEAYTEALPQATSTARPFRFAYHRLTERFNRLPLPEVRLIDMSLEFTERRNRSIFSMALKAELSRVLESGGQALLFLNRRGHSTYVFCRACGHPVGCSACSVTLTFHMATGRMLCHLCGYEATPPRACPKCSDPAIRFCGGGTQKVEEEFRANFPGIEVCRMDSDTTSSRGSHQRIIGDYAAGRTRVLVGTQMVAKGFDFPNLDLVGVVNADSILHTNDFRSAERTFQIVTQVAGRVGRGERPGLVLVQTYSPRHYALAASVHHDYEEFAKLELPQRQALVYPPYSRLVALTCESLDEEAAKATLHELKRDLERPELRAGAVRILGPAPAHVARIAERYRYALLLKIPLASSGAVPGPVDAVVREVLRAFTPPPKTALKVDVDPL